MTLEVVPFAGHLSHSNTSYTTAHNMTIKQQAFEQKFNTFATSDNAPLDFVTTLRFRVTNAKECVIVPPGTNVVR